MDRDTAVVRIQDGLGFRGDLSSKIVIRLQEAQRKFEAGKTLPWFLIRGATLTIPAGLNYVEAPTGYIREAENYTIVYVDSSNLLVHLKRVTAKALDEAFPGQFAGTGTPSVYMEWEDFSTFPTVGRGFFFNIAVAADFNTTITYYKGADVLTTNMENLWLANAPEVLIGEAGMRMAMDLRDSDGIAIFKQMRDDAWDAIFRETIFRRDMNMKPHLGEDF